MLVARPAIHEVIESEAVTHNCSLDVVDFGCGTGALAQQLSRMRHRVVAYDISRAMIAEARSCNPFDVSFALGGNERLAQFSQHDAVCATIVTNYLSSIREFAEACSMLYASKWYRYLC